ncbi:MAG: hypothetical protein ACRDZQ_04915 [Acidimicrobiales bacterium]
MPERAERPPRGIVDTSVVVDLEQLDAAVLPLTTPDDLRGLADLVEVVAV